MKCKNKDNKKYGPKQEKKKKKKKKNNNKNTQTDTVISSIERETAGQNGFTIEIAAALAITTTTILFIADGDD